MKIHTTIITFLTTVQALMGQIGIRTTNPSAMLDVVADNNINNTHIIKIRDNSKQDLMSVGKNGNLFFKRSLIANNSSGTSGYVLGSNGANTSPQWKDVSNSPLYKYVAIAYHAQNSLSISGLASNSDISIDFGTSPTISSSVIGNWKSTTKRYTVLENGIYDITATVPLSTSQSSSNRKAVMTINLGSYKQLYKATRNQGSSYNMTCTGKVTRYLTAGTEIWVTVQTSNLNTSQSTWQYKDAILNINYSPKTN
ncbi:cupredoxin domain-containing protein [Chryseobacterium oryctis]|uniref:Cleaved Adhesin Domain n=1 Tax=Chryseobacterium oryctis TaxID=2952618 RepID=A0ABT3HRP0_9FLAO|nr:hypothetical protein [Chryseobacterium oryctis]MCW3162437.1 hypothetical protein [Chryseobacterium oryctis]